MTGMEEVVDTAVKAHSQVDRALKSKIRGSGVRSPVLVWCRSVGQTLYSILPQSAQPCQVPGAQIQGWIHSCRLYWHPPCQGKVKSVEHALSWSLDSK